jgi:predicted 3-demethylubiquinone-9 3-methyltransferase (glyoxalase superfamily)
MERITSSQKIIPFLWFDKEAEEAVNFYTSIFKDSKIKNIARYGKGGPAPEGSVMTVDFELAGQKFLALNGGPHYKFTPAVSFVITCDTQEEIDHYWNKLSSGQFEQCGWLVDKFGLSWQVVPSNMGQLMTGPNSQRAMQAMMKMKKLIIADLENA